MFQSKLQATPPCAVSFHLLASKTVPPAELHSFTPTGFNAVPLVRKKSVLHHLRCACASDFLSQPFFVKTALRERSSISLSRITASGNKPFLVKKFQQWRIGVNSLTPKPTGPDRTLCATKRFSNSLKHDPPCRWCRSNFQI